VKFVILIKTIHISMNKILKHTPTWEPRKRKRDWPRAYYPFSTGIWYL